MPIQQTFVHTTHSRPINLLFDCDDGQTTTTTRRQEYIYFNSLLMQKFFRKVVYLFIFGPTHCVTAIILHWKWIGRALSADRSRWRKMRLRANQIGCDQQWFHFPADGRRQNRMANRLKGIEKKCWTINNKVICFAKDANEWQNVPLLCCYLYFWAQISGSSTQFVYIVIDGSPGKQ